MTLLFSLVERGFFDTEIHRVIPADADEVTPEKRVEILEGVARGQLVERVGGEFVLIDPVADPAALEAQERQAERDWRDAEFARVQWLRDRHRDEQEQRLATTLSYIQYAELLGYLQLLRDWPQSVDFPDSARRPVTPGWIAVSASP